jgi:NAD(P)-dependent dehydrogenase (short-subunit alcohol dehydrogenase family)
MTASAETQTIAAALQAGGTAVVTGGASGIGLATAKKLAARGLNVVIADREGARLYQAIRDLAALASGGEDEVMGFACDVSRPDDVARLAEATHEKFGDV